jgi:uncharacterized membrane protein
VVFGAHTIFRIGLAIIFNFGGLFGLGVWTMISSLLTLVGLILWILLMIKAYQHQLYKVPIAAGIAEGIAGK